MESNENVKQAIRAAEKVIGKKPRRTRIVLRGHQTEALDEYLRQAWGTWRGGRAGLALRASKDLGFKVTPGHLDTAVRRKVVCGFRQRGVARRATLATLATSIPKVGRERASTNPEGLLSAIRVICKMKENWTSGVILALIGD